MLITPTIVNDDDDAKILPSNDTGKSTDTEGVELSVYPDSGSLVAPPKVNNVLTGGSARKDQNQVLSTRRKKKIVVRIRSDTRRQQPRTTIVLVVQGLLILHWEMSTDTEEVERQLYLENSSGAVFTPPEIDVLVGGKSKGGTRNKKRSKKTATNNNNCCGGVRTYHTPFPPVPNKARFNYHCHAVRCYPSNEAKTEELVLRWCLILR